MPCLFGLNFSDLTIDEVGFQILSPIGSFGNAYHLVNAHTISIVQDTHGFKELLHQGNLLCDGKPLATLLKLKCHTFSGQIRGADLMRHVLVSSPAEVGHFFLGSTHEILEKLVFNAKSLNHDLKVVGTYSPSFQSEFKEEVFDWIKRISESKAHVVWVGLGTPKQDFVSQAISMNIPVNTVSVGAAFNYLAGTKTEAPRLFTRFGFEWLYRLIQEPRRLTSRYSLGNIKFILYIIKNWRS